jgi:transmembrane sensor
MTISPDTNRDRAEDEAATWLVLLSEGPADPELRARFEAWRTASALNAEIWARTSRAYDLVGQGTPRHAERWQPFARMRGQRPPLPGGRPRIGMPPRPPAARFPLTRLSAGIAAALVLIGVMIGFAPQMLLRLEADHVTGTAEIRVIALADGTEMRLGPESAIGVSFSNDERRIHLLKGSAFFDVARDAERPFRVAAGDAVATVLGTAFDVRLGKDAAEIGVQRGLVRVDDGGVSPPVSENLKAGDWLRVNRRVGATRGSVRPDEIADWVRGELVARDRPIREIVDELRRYHRGAIVVADASFAERRVSGIYDLRDPVATLRGLASAHNAAVHGIPWLLVIAPQ